MERWIVYFAKNLQYLRKRDKITQEDLADKLGVSRQSISKWETGEAYPETDKLLVLCDLFSVSLDALMRGDLTKTDETAQAEPEPPQLAGGREYAAHMNKFSRAMAFGVALVLFGIALCVALSGVGESQTGTLSRVLSVFGGVSVVLCVAIAVFLFVFYGMADDRFKKEHPAIDDPFAESEIKAFSKRFPVAMACLVSGILIDVAALVVFSTLIEEDIIAVGSYSKGAVVCYVVAAFFAVLSLLVGGLVYYGIQSEKFKISEYNRQAERERDPSASEKLIGAINGVVMLAATAIFLVVGFVWNWWHPGWIVFPVGGIICAIVSTIFRGKKR